MQSRSRVPRKPSHRDAARSPLATNSREDAELEAIAFLCLLFAWPPEEPKPPHLRLVSERS